MIDGIPVRSGVRFGKEAQGLRNAALAPTLRFPDANAAAYDGKFPVHASTLNHASPVEFAGAFSKPGTIYVFPVGSVHVPSPKNEEPTAAAPEKEAIRVKLAESVPP